MKTGFLVLVAPTLLAATSALADDKAACLDAVAKGQRLREAHELVEAREQLRVCAAARCPGVVQSDCANWLADVDKAIPTVVLTAKSGAGVDLVDVKVSVDGQPLVSKLDGQAQSINAGPHAFHFEGPDGVSLDQHVLVKEGVKNLPVAVVLGAASAAPASPAAGTAAPGQAWSPWKAVGLVVGGAGVVGLGVGAVFGVMALGKKGIAHCDSNNVCDPGTTGAIKSTALVSDVGWIAGGVLLASGAAMVLFAPGAGHEAGASVRAAPVLTASGGGVVVGGTW